ERIGAEVAERPRVQALRGGRGPVWSPQAGGSSHTRPLAPEEAAICDPFSTVGWQARGHSNHRGTAAAKPHPAATRRRGPPSSKSSGGGSRREWSLRERARPT